jgi:hypothetical protein
MPWFTQKKKKKKKEERSSLDIHIWSIKEMLGKLKTYRHIVHRFHGFYEVQVQPYLYDQDKGPQFPPVRFLTTNLS